MEDAVSTFKRVRLVILGGGPAGNTCASVAATLGADVTLVERDVIAGASGTASRRRR
jgi:flavin-dependent dehydrogenase